MEVAEDQTPGAVGRSLWAGAASRIVRGRSDLLLAALDVVMLAAAYTLTLLLRFDGAVPDGYWHVFQVFVPFAAALGVIANRMCGLYGQIWRHASMQEAQRLLLSGGIVIGVLLGSEVFTGRRVPLSVVLLGTGLGVFFMAAVRFQSRLFSFRRRAGESGLRIIVIGAYDAGAALVREMVMSPAAGLVPVAVLDPDPRQRGRSILGVRVEGGIDALPSVATRLGAHQAVLAMTNFDHGLLRQVVTAAETAGIALKIAPGLAHQMREGVSLHDIRDISIEDLLGRQEVVIDDAAVESMIKGRRVLITGAGGSIGSEIARQVSRCEPSHLALVDHDESHLHDLAVSLTNPTVQVLADVRDATLVRRVFDRHRPDIVFHAAAHKHVPLLEDHPCEAVMTNVVGTRNVLDACTAAGVERFVFISTDKAVRPTSVMGASKRVGEQLALASQADGARHCAVRFGNVLGSRGSVIPTFMRQIAAGGPVTVTDERMTRYFMSIEESVQLVLQAAALADGGEVFVLDMGEPVRILDLAKRMIRLSGRRVGHDVEIRITGVRPGEKLVEELLGTEECEHPTVHPSITRIAPVVMGRAELEGRVAAVAEAAGALLADEARQLLFDLVTDVTLDARPAAAAEPSAVPRPA